MDDVVSGRSELRYRRCDDDRGVLEIEDEKGCKEICHGDADEVAEMYDRIIRHFMRGIPAFRPPLS